MVTATEIERLIVRLVGDASGYIKELTKAQQATRAAVAKIRSSINSVGKLTLAAAAPAATALFAKSISEASKAQETMSKFEAVFGDQSKAVKAFAKDVARATNRSGTDIASYLAEFQDLFVPLGMTSDAAAEVSKTLTQLGIDMASFDNRNEADVMRDLQSAMTGSSEVMKKYGVIVNETAVKQRLLAQGLNPSAATEAQKAMARLTIIMEGTTDAQGDAERTAGSYANQMKGLQAAIKDVYIEIGTQLIPILTPAITSLAELARTFGAAARESNGFAKSLVLLLDILHTVQIGFKYTQSLTMAFLSGLYAALDETIQDLKDLFNIIPGVEIESNPGLSNMADELMKQSLALWEEGNQMLLDVTPSERFAAAARAATRSAEVAVAATNRQALAQQQLLDGLEEQEKIYERLARQAHQLILAQLTPLEKLKKEITDIEFLWKAGALTTAEAKSIIDGKLQEFGAQRTSKVASGGAAVRAESAEGYSLLNFGQAEKTSEETLKKMLEATKLSIRTEQQIVEELRRQRQHAPPLHAAAIP